MTAQSERSDSPADRSITRRREGAFVVVECDFSGRMEKPAAARVMLAARGDWRNTWLLTGREAWKLARALDEAAVDIVPLSELGESR